MTDEKESQRTPEEIASKTMLKILEGLKLAASSRIHEIIRNPIAEVIRAERARKSEPSKSFEEYADEHLGGRIIGTEDEIAIDMQKKIARTNHLKTWQAATEAERVRIWECIPRQYEIAAKGIEYLEPKAINSIGDWLLACAWFKKLIGDRIGVGAKGET